MIAPGTSLLHYRLVEKVGEGGHVVFEGPPDASVVPAPHGDRFLVMTPVGKRSNALTLVQNRSAQPEQHE